MVRKTFNKAYRGGRQHLYQRPYILPIFGLLIGALIVLGVVLTRGTDTLKVSDHHVVFLFDRGERTTLDTKATTVGKLIKDLPLNLTEEDVIEPSRSSKIVEDNYRINIYRARPVTIVDRGQKKVSLTAQRSARVVAQKAGLKIFPEDEIIFAQGDIRNNTIGEEVIVNRATRIVLNLYGRSIKMHTHAKTVGELLIQRGVKPKKGDTIKPSKTTKIRENLQIFVIRNGVRILTKEEKIPAPIKYVDDASLSLGATAVREKGSDGKRAVTYQITTKNGKISKRKIIQTVIIEQASPRVVARGSVVNVSGNKEKLMKAAGISSGDYGYVNFIISHESNWNPAARNAGGCLGLGQACPGSKLTAVCSLGDPVCQLKFFSGYADGRYGGWSGAYNFWVGNNYW